MKPRMLFETPQEKALRHFLRTVAKVPYQLPKASRKKFGRTPLHMEAFYPSGLVGIPVTNLSVNPARSTRPALFVGGWAVQQLWLFWVAPIVGAALAGIVYPAIAGEPEQARSAAA